MRRYQNTAYHRGERTSTAFGIGRVSKTFSPQYTDARSTREPDTNTNPVDATKIEKRGSLSHDATAEIALHRVLGSNGISHTAFTFKALRARGESPPAVVAFTQLQFRNGFTTNQIAPISVHTSYPPASGRQCATRGVTRPFIKEAATLDGNSVNSDRRAAKQVVGSLPSRERFPVWRELPDVEGSP